MKTFEQGSPAVDNGGLDSGSTYVYANRQRLTQIGASGLSLHNGLCIIRTLCNSTGRDDHSRDPSQEQAGLFVTAPHDKGAEDYL